MAQTRTLWVFLLTVISVSLINFQVVDADFYEINQIPNDDVKEFSNHAADPQSDTRVSKAFRSWIFWWLETATLSRRLLVGIERILDVFARHTDELLVDALLGVKISNDQLNATLDRIAERDSEMASIIRKLITNGVEIMEIALPKTRDKFKDFEVVGSVLNLNMDWRRAPKSFSKSVSLHSLDEHDELDAECQSPFNEILSDHCISQLLPDERLSYDTPTRCELDDGCIERVFLSCNGYTATHQALYLMIGIKSECSQQLRAKLLQMAPSAVQQQLTIDSIIEGYCMEIYRESLNISKAGFPHDKRDQFIEQAVICGLFNYVDFFRLDWAERILSWQQADGCYYRIDTHRDQKAEPGASTLHHREKRHELTFKDGCSSHTTSLAISYFSILLRHITRAV
ncbi:UPF0764 protein C16orf89 homolog [Strongylocentrotus purpuratus]|uniref:Uncharacterized protein n=1 Tax=Strongylocentrotus purpuratus TaxID=7668 RepID=A0A7M7NRC7_STRPU|nr:UPF0764 protein C16orf89 homolog [Strongylocentrotus purpuratus]